jgi:hypothetical protein
MAGSDDARREALRAELRRRLAELKKNPKSRFELQLLLRVPTIAPEGRVAYTTAHAQMVVNVSEETVLAIQALPPALHENALSGEQHAALVALAETAAEEVKEQIIANADALTPVVKKLLTEIIATRWNGPERELGDVN